MAVGCHDLFLGSVVGDATRKRIAAGPPQESATLIVLYGIRGNVGAGNTQVSGNKEMHTLSVRHRQEAGVGRVERVSRGACVGHG